MNDDEAPGGGLPPWINPEIQQRIAWRDGDIVISVPPKSGTTWTMNIVHQLRTGGDDSFRDVDEEVPWIEFVARPDITPDDVVATIDAMPSDRRRAFKTHAGPGVVPYHAPGSGVDVRYVVVVRNPDEAVASFHPFIGSHSDAWFELWGAPREAVVAPDFATYFEGMGSHAIAPMVFDVVNGWWPLRHEPNVVMVHYADLVRDPETSIRRIADTLGFDPTPDQWVRVLDHTSFSWMKSHEHLFEARVASGGILLDPGAMIRKGKVGDSSSDGVTPEISERIAAIGRSIVPDPAALAWCYDGGPLP